MDKCINQTQHSDLINTNFEDHAKIEKALLKPNYTSLKNQVLPKLGRRKCRFITQETKM